MTNREAMQMALDVLTNKRYAPSIKETTEALRAALAQPDVPETAFGETEPVAWGVGNTRPTEKGQFIMLLHSLYAYKDLLVPLYAAPPRREWVGLTDEKSQPEEKYYKQAVDGEIPEAYTPAKGGLLPEQKPEPFGIWHQGDTSEECDFFLYADAGDVTCDTCVKLYTAPSKREWVGLTYLEKEVIITDCTDEEQNHWVNASAVADLIEDKLKEKNA